MEDYREQQKEKILSDIKVWWEQSQKYGAKKPFWRIYHSSTKAVKGKKFQENTELEDVDKSLDCLLDNLSSMMPYLDKYVLISLATSKNDPAPTQFIVENPLYVSNISQSGNTINGIGNTSNSNMPVINTGYSKQDVDKMVQERLDVFNKLHKEQLDNLRKEMEYKKELEDMRNQIEGIAESQKTTFEKILGIAEHPVISSALQVIIARLIPDTLTTNKDQSKKVVNQNNVTNQNKVAGNEKSNDETGLIDDDESYENEDSEEIYAEKFEKGIESLENVFPNESAEVIEELGELARRNPEILKQLRQSMQQMINK
jgi:hypothetical protein